MTGGLEQLDTILEGERFKNLERLEFTLSPVPREFNFTLSLVDERLQEGIEERLQKLCARGVRVLPTLLKGRGMSMPPYLICFVVALADKFYVNM